MIRHIVAFRLATADPDARRRQAAEIRDRLTSLVGQIPGLLALDVFEDVGVVPSHWRLFRFQWGRVEVIRGGWIGRGQVTPPA